MRSLSAIQLFFTGLLLFTLLRITPAQGQLKLALPAGQWKDADEYMVKGRTGIMINQKLLFGEYYTTVVDRSWTKGSSNLSGLSMGVPTDEQFQRIITSEKIRKSQTLFFNLADSSGNEARAYCISQFKSKDFTIGNNPVSVVNIFGDILGIGDSYSSTFYVMIYDATQSYRWELLLNNAEVQSSPKEYVGYLAQGRNNYYSIHPLSKVVNKKGKAGTMPFGSAGFEIRNSAGEPVAAVSLIDRGVVYLKALNPQERILLATACSALLLQEQIGS